MCSWASSMTKRCGRLIPSSVLSIVLLSMLTQRAAPGARKFLSHTHTHRKKQKNKGCHFTLNVCISASASDDFTHTCRSPPPSLQSWNFLHVEPPHRPARNTGSPLADRQKEVRKTHNEARQRDTKQVTNMIRL